MNTDESGKEMPNTVLSVANTVCPECGSKEFEMRNYSEMWHDGDIYCAKCGKFIRYFDAG